MCQKALEKIYYDEDGAFVICKNCGDHFSIVDEVEDFINFLPYKDDEKDDLREAFAEFIKRGAQ